MQKTQNSRLNHGKISSIHQLCDGKNYNFDALTYNKPGTAQIGAISKAH